MRVYLALGDSISIDDYTGVSGGGAASQLARMASLELIDLTRDGNTTDGVLAISLEHQGRPTLSRSPPAAMTYFAVAGRVRSWASFTRSHEGSCRSAHAS
jgi:hypothetical protein